jgi:hypothetical protein
MVAETTTGKIPQYSPRVTCITVVHRLSMPEVGVRLTGISYLFAILTGNGIYFFCSRTDGPKPPPRAPSTLTRAIAWRRRLLLRIPGSAGRCAAVRAVDPTVTLCRLHIPVPPSWSQGVITCADCHYSTSSLVAVSLGLQNRTVGATLLPLASCYHIQLLTVSGVGPDIVCRYT